MSQAKLEETQATIRFSAAFGAIIPVPDPAALPTNGNPIVEGTIHGFPFRAPFEPGVGLRLSQALQNAAGGKPGQMVAVEITRIGDEPEVRVPSDFRTALEESGALALFEDVTPMARREWVRWIASAKQEQTRQKRIEVGIDKLTKGMRRPCCFPGLNFVTKDLVSPEETWGALPGLGREPSR
jgi:hypothetical protein